MSRQILFGSYQKDSYGTNLGFYHLCRVVEVRIEDLVTDGLFKTIIHKNDNNLEVNLIDTTCELIDGKLHTKCISGQQRTLSVG